MLVSWCENLKATFERGNIINYFNDLVCTILLILMNLKSIFKGKSLNHKLRVVTGIAAFYKICNKLPREIYVETCEMRY